jgi:hypothetical protein
MATRVTRYVKPDPIQWAEIKLEYLHLLAQRLPRCPDRYIEDVIKRKHG